MELLSMMLLLPFLFLLSFTFSGAEASLFSIGKVEWQTIFRKKVYPYPLLSTLIKNKDELLATILLGNELTNVTISYIGAYTLFLFFGISAKEYSFLNILFITPLILLFGEMIPKTIGLRYPVSFSKVAALPLFLIYYLTKPVKRILVVITESLTSLLGVRGETTPFIDEEELVVMSEIMKETGNLEEIELGIILNGFKLKDITVRRLMTPKNDIFSLPSDMPIRSALEEVKNNPYSRIPVYEGEKDNIVGILYKKRLLSILLEEEKDGEVMGLKNFILPVKFIPETKRATELLLEFQKEKTHIGLVVDEYGALRGLITLDDLLERLIEGGSEVKLEDKERAYFRKVGKDIYMVSGKMEIEKLNRIVDTEIDVEVANTIGGYLFHVVGRIPEKGETFDIDGIRYEIIKSSGVRVGDMEIQMKMARQDRDLGCTEGENTSR